LKNAGDIEPTRNQNLKYYAAHLFNSSQNTFSAALHSQRFLM